MDKRSILVVNTVPTDRNGITNVILGIHDHIDHERFSVDYVLINDCDDSIKEHLKNKGGSVHIIKDRMSSPLRYMRKLRRIARGHDIIHVHGNSATMTLEMLAAKAAGVPFRIAHSHNTFCRYRSADKLLRPLFYALCNGHLACSDPAGKWLFKSKGFTVYKNGIDTGKYSFSAGSRASVREELGWKDKIILGHVGEFNQVKNQRFIVDILKVLAGKSDHYRLLLIGDGPLNSDIAAYARQMELEDRVVFYGKTDHVNDLLNAIDIIIMPSINEGFPLTLVEEQANGLQCVISDSITKDIDICGGVHFLSLSAGPEAWADAVMGISLQEDRTQVSGTNVRILKDKGFDAAMAVISIEEFYLTGAGS